MIKHEDISQRAREIWEREGRPEGRDMQHWLQAEAELRRESEQGSARSRPSAEDHAVAKVSSGMDGQENGRRRAGRRGKELH
jgi:hypothetical protein